MGGGDGGRRVWGQAALRRGFARRMCGRGAVGRCVGEARAVGRGWVLGVGGGDGVRRVWGQAALG